MVGNRDERLHRRHLHVRIKKIIYKFLKTKIIKIGMDIIVVKANKLKQKIKENKTNQKKNEKRTLIELIKSEKAKAELEKSKTGKAHKSAKINRSEPKKNKNISRSKNFSLISVRREKNQKAENVTNKMQIKEHKKKTFIRETISKSSALIKRNQAKVITLLCFFMLVLGLSIGTVSLTNHLALKNKNLTDKERFIDFHK